MKLHRRHSPRFQIPGLLLAALLLSSCASMTSGTTQRIDIVTDPQGAAACTLVNEKGSWTLTQTPGAAMIDRAHGDLTVACTTTEGASGSAAVVSGVAGATFGNILLIGSVVWAAVDLASGAAFAYPDSVTVVMATPADAALVAFPPLALIQVAALPRPAPVTAPPDDARSRLRQLQAHREANRISEPDYQARVKQIVETVGAARPPAATP